MNDDVIIFGIGGLVSIGYGIYELLKGFYHFKFRQMIHNTQTTPLGNIVREGFYEVNALVTSQDNPTYNSPLSGKPCVYYLITTRQYDKSLEIWRETDRVQNGYDLVIKDGSGKAVITESNASFELQNVFEYSNEEQDSEMPDFLVSYLTKRGLDMSDESDEIVYVSETIIYPDMFLYVLGYARKREELFQFGTFKNYPYIVSDRPEEKLKKVLLSSGYSSIGIGIALICFGIGLFVYLTYLLDIKFN